MNSRVISHYETRRTNAFIQCNQTSLSIVFKVLLIILLFETRVSSQSKQIRNLQTFEDNSEPVFRVVVNSDTNEIIVGARNVIYKLSADDLQKTEEFKTGPVNDSTECLPPPNNCAANKRLVNNDNKILLLKTQKKSWPFILACGDAYQGLCHILKAENLSWHRTYGSADDTLNFLGSRSSGYALFAPSSIPNRDSIYVAQAYDGRPLAFSPPAVSSRIMNGLEGFQLTHSSDNSYTKVDIHPKYKQTFDVKYIYGFSHSHYSYFLSNQPMSVKDGAGYEAKLIRICQNDNQFFSYMEIPLICTENKNGRNFEHSVASTAYFGKAGENMYRQLNIREESDSDTLFITMGVPAMGRSDRLNGTIGTAICAFTIKQITKAFTEAAQQCFRAENHVSSIETIVGHKKECSYLNQQVNDNFCGTGLNPHIGTTKPLSGVILSLIKGYVTSLAVAVQKRSTVAAIGTDDGWIKKIKLDESTAADKPIFQMNIANLSGQSTDRAIRPNPAFDKNEKFLYILSGNSVIKFPFGSCSLHTDCGTCLNTEIDDPLGCGWCDSYCATAEECDKPPLFSKSRCPPEVFEFSPTSGPLSGGTKITIRGDNLGSAQSSIENSNIFVTIGESGPLCEVSDWQQRRVQCITKAVQKAFSAKLFVTVHDYTGDGRFDVNGTAISKEEFTYLEPQLLGVFPSFGPLDGGTNVTLVGKNLHIGSNRTIFLAGVECKETQNNSTFLTCLSGRSSTISEDMSIRLIIDSEQLIVNQNKTINSVDTFRDTDYPRKLENKDEYYSYEWSEYFQYKPNPKIESYHPNTTIKSGNTTITVKGVNLNSVANPRIEIKAYSQITKEEVRTEGKCQVNPKGTEMVCWTPPIRDPIPPPKILIPIVSQLSFILDGVKNYSTYSSFSHKSRLIYFPDPTYHAFDENVRVVYLEEPMLKIDGKDLTSDYPIDIKISDKYHVPCNTTETKSFDAIYCQVTYHDKLFQDDGEEHVVNIRVGRITFSPGRIRFESKPSHASVGAIMVSTLVPVLVIAAIIIGVLYYLKKNGIIMKEKKPLHFVAYDPNDPDSPRPPYSNQTSNNDYEGHGVTRPLLPVRRFQVSEDTMNLLRAESILIDRSNITLEQVLGQGHFGCVYKGIIHYPEKEVDREVALKTLQAAVVREEMDVEAFLQEGLIMKDFKHHHVLTLIGVSFEEDGSPIVVLPFMENGDLLSYIRDEQNNPTVKNLLMFAIDIAKGMDYLSSQKFVHRDLAARNCMLDCDLSAKVADFGLSRDIYEREYYSSDNKKCKLPVKWMSPESLEKGTYNTKTDVWSYGVLVWELLTRGVTPYPDVDNWEILNYLKQGRRMPRPSFCPELLYYILLRCWSDDPKQRPNFGELVEEVQTLIAKLEKGADKQKVELDKCNTYANFPVANTYYNEQLSQSTSQSTSQSQSEAKPSAPTYETTC